MGRKELVLVRALERRRVTIVDGLGDYIVMERIDDISISRTRDSKRYEYERKGRGK